MPNTDLTGTGSLSPFQAIKIQARDLIRTIRIAITRPYELRAALR